MFKARKLAPRGGISAGKDCVDLRRIAVFIFYIRVARDLDRRGFAVGDIERSAQDHIGIERHFVASDDQNIVKARFSSDGIFDLGQFAFKLEHILADRELSRIDALFGVFIHEVICPKSRRNAADHQQHDKTQKDVKRDARALRKVFFLFILFGYSLRLLQ